MFPRGDVQAGKPVFGAESTATGRPEGVGSEEFLDGADDAAGGGPGGVGITGVVAVLPADPGGDGRAFGVGVAVGVAHRREVVVAAGTLVGDRGLSLGYCRRGA